MFKKLFVVLSLVVSLLHSFYVHAEYITDIDLNTGEQSFYLIDSSLQNKTSLPKLSVEPTAIGIQPCRITVTSNIPRAQMIGGSSASYEFTQRCVDAYATIKITNLSNASLRIVLQKRASNGTWATVTSTSSLSLSLRLATGTYRWSILNVSSPGVTATFYGSYTSVI